MKKILVMALAFVMFVSPVMSAAAAVEPVRQTQLQKETFEDPRYYRRYPYRRDRRYRRSSSGGWVAAGILGAALIGSAIASSSRSHNDGYYSSAPTYVYPSTPTYVYPSTPTYVYPSTSSNVVVDPNVYMYDANGNLVPYVPGY